jgi:hypothetical protein
LTNTTPVLIRAIRSRLLTDLAALRDYRRVMVAARLEEYVRDQADGQVPELARKTEARLTRIASLTRTARRLDTAREILLSIDNPTPEDLDQALEVIGLAISGSDSDSIDNQLEDELLFARSTRPSPLKNHHDVTFKAGGREGADTLKDLHDSKIRRIIGN